MRHGITFFHAIHYGRYENRNSRNPGIVQNGTEDLCANNKRRPGSCPHEPAFLTAFPAKYVLFSF